MKKSNYKIPEKIYIGLILLLFYIPIFVTVVFSFNSSKSLSNLSGFSFKWYKELFLNPVLVQAMAVTFIIALVSSIISTFIGTLGAISLKRYKLKMQKAVLMLNNIPIVSPEIITAISLFLLFGAFMIPFGYTTLIMAHVAFSTPYVIVAVWPKVKELDENLINAAYDLGANHFQALYKVVLPQIKGGIISGFMIAFAMSFDDFVISYFAVGSSGISNISIYLYTLKRGLNPSINALSTIIVLIVFIKVTYDYFKKSTKDKVRKVVRK